MTRTASKPLPKPFYAAAGAGDYVVEQLTRQLRQLPETVEELRGRAAAIALQARAKVTDTAANIDVRADLARVRQAARDRAAALAVAAQRQATAASERGAALYEQLAARGAKVVESRNGRGSATPKLSAVPDERAKQAKATKPATKTTKATSSGSRG